LQNLIFAKNRKTEKQKNDTMQSCISWPSLELRAWTDMLRRTVTLIVIWFPCLTTICGKVMLQSDAWSLNLFGCIHLSAKQAASFHALPCLPPPFEDKWTWSVAEHHPKPLEQQKLNLVDIQFAMSFWVAILAKWVHPCPRPSTPRH
jgi:hypothetical protein